MRKIMLQLNETENEMFEVIRERYGSKATVFLKYLIMDKFSRDFPGYRTGVKKITEIDPEEVMTNEQLCEARGGTVKTIEGLKVCSFPTDSKFTKWDIPIGDRERIQAVKIR